MVTKMRGLPLEIDKVKLGQKIKKLRKIKNLTQSELAEKVDLNEKQISRIEAGLNYPAFITFIKLVEILNLDLDEFLRSSEFEINPVREEINHLIQNSSDLELKIYLEILKPLKKNLKNCEIKIKKAP